MATSSIKNSSSVHHVEKEYLLDASTEARVKKEMEHDYSDVDDDEDNCINVDHKYSNYSLPDVPEAVLNDSNRQEEEEANNPNYWREKTFQIVVEKNKKPLDRKMVEEKCEVFRKFCHKVLAEEPPNPKYKALIEVHHKYCIYIYIYSDANKNLIM
jgi:hypothetical protein